MQIDSGETRLVITIPQNDFLSEKGVMWGLLANVCKTAPAKTSRYSRSHSEPVDNRWSLSGVLPNARLNIALQEVGRNVVVGRHAPNAFRPNQINQTKEIQSA
jgi:hypothetical protein